MVPHPQSDGPRVVTVIAPGAGTMQNQAAYTSLQDHGRLRVDIEGKTGANYDAYPPGWPGGKIGPNLLSFAEGLTDSGALMASDCVVFGSRGGQVVLPELWRNYGNSMPPTVVINGGCAMTGMPNEGWKHWPRHAVTMLLLGGDDYFRQKASSEEYLTDAMACVPTESSTTAILYIDQMSHMPETSLLRALLEDMLLVVMSWAKDDRTPPQRFGKIVQRARRAQLSGRLALKVSRGDKWIEIDFDKANVSKIFRRVPSRHDAQIKWTGTKFRDPKIGWSNDEKIGQPSATSWENLKLGESHRNTSTALPQTQFDQDRKRAPGSDTNSNFQKSVWDQFEDNVKRLGTLINSRSQSTPPPRTEQVGNSAANNGLTDTPALTSVKIDLRTMSPPSRTAKVGNLARSRPLADNSAFTRLNTNSRNPSTPPPRTEQVGNSAAYNGYTPAHTSVKINSRIRAVSPTLNYTKVPGIMPDLSLTTTQVRVDVETAAAHALSVETCPRTLKTDAFHYSPEKPNSIPMTPRQRIAEMVSCVKKRPNINDQPLCRTKTGLGRAPVAATSGPSTFNFPWTSRDARNNIQSDCPVEENAVYMNPRTFEFPALQCHSVREFGPSVCESSKATDLTGHRLKPEKTSAKPGISTPAEPIDSSGKLKRFVFRQSLTKIRDNGPFQKKADPEVAVNVPGV